MEILTALSIIAMIIINIMIYLNQLKKNKKGHRYKQSNKKIKI